MNYKEQVKFYDEQLKTPFDITQIGMIPEPKPLTLDDLNDMKDHLEIFFYTSKEFKMMRIFGAERLNDSLDEWQKTKHDMMLDYMHEKCTSDEQKKRFLARMNISNCWIQYINLRTKANSSSFYTPYIKTMRKELSLFKKDKCYNQMLSFATSYDEYLKSREDLRGSD